MLDSTNTQTWENNSDVVLIDPSWGRCPHFYSLETRSIYNKRSNGEGTKTTIKLVSAPQSAICDEIHRIPSQLFRIYHLSELNKCISDLPFIQVLLKPKEANANRLFSTESNEQ
jgi:hypothetical protein